MSHADRILENLASGPKTAPEIASDLGCPTGIASRVLERLEQQKRVRRGGSAKPPGGTRVAWLWRLT